MDKEPGKPFLIQIFIKITSAKKVELKKKIDRFFGLIHGKNGLTPTLNEKGMYAAFQHHYNQLVYHVSGRLHFG